MSESSSVQPDVSGRIALISKIKTGAFLALAFAVCAFSAACSPSSSSSAGKTPSPAAGESQPAIGAIAPLPPNSGDRPLQAGQSGTEYMPNGLPALTPVSKGPSADQLFAEKISSDSARFKRLENAVADLRREFDAVKPAIIRLTAVEADMEELVTQLQSLIPGGAANINDTGAIPDLGPMADNAATEDLAGTPEAEPPFKPAVVTPITKTQAIAPITAIPPPSAAQQAEADELAAQKPIAVIKAPALEETPKIVKAPAATVTPIAGGPAAVQGVRIADHAGSTRIVIDLSSKANFTHSIDNSEHILMIEIPGAKLQGPAQGSAKSPLVPSWTASADAQGVVLLIELKNNAVLGSAITLPAGAGAPYRIVFDLKPSS